VGDYRLLYEILDAERLVLVAGIVTRKDLEAWIRRHRG
jgi:mRNA-degrading endonuclease RelE of RelBE toxin-antitoxin system